MKIRNHRKREWWFYPAENSKLHRVNCYRFKYKSDLMQFLNNNFREAINGEVRLEESSFGSSGAIRRWFVWYNDFARHYNRKRSSLQIELRQQDFRGRKFIHKPSPISKVSKKYFAHSKKVINLMCNIYQADEKTILPKDAKKLVELFYKRGFKDFEPTEEDLYYINGHIGDGISFWHWSDRCNWLRTKTIIEYFKREGLLC